ncbi:MAG: transposase [Treponema sp.]|nr:transposase [Treponema sp.]
MIGRPVHTPSNQRFALAPGVRTQINNREPLFRENKALEIFDRVLRETKLRFVFEIRYIHLEDDWFTFYIKPEDGLKLPCIMKRLKQTFAQRYNRETGRPGGSGTSGGTGIGREYWKGIRRKMRKTAGRRGL